MIKVLPEQREECAVSVGSRVAFVTWRLYRTSAVARVALDPVIKRSAVAGLARHAAFVTDALAKARVAAPRETSGAPLRVVLGPVTASATKDRLFALLNHWGARYEVARRDVRGLLLEGARGASLAIEPLADGPRLETLRGHAALARVYGESPSPDLRARDDAGRLVLDAGILAPGFVTSAWGSVLPDAIDGVVGARDWRSPLPPLVSARVDDVTGAGGLGWLAALEAQGLRPSIGTLHDTWLASGESAVQGIVAAAKRGSSVSPHAFSMDRFFWFDAPHAAPFSDESVAAHWAKVDRDCRATGLVLGKTINAHFDVIGANAARAAIERGFRYVLGEHELSQDWREAPRARDPLGTPLYSYGPAGDGLFGFQAGGSLPSSAAPASRYDWLRNFLEVDRRTNRPVRASLDRAGAVRQGVTQLLSALFAGFPAYLIAHEIHLDTIGGELVGEVLEAVLREVKARVPEIRPAPFDELPASCAARATG
jgi:hypothetical protein